MRASFWRGAIILIRNDCGDIFHEMRDKGYTVEGCHPTNEEMRRAGTLHQILTC